MSSQWESIGDRPSNVWSDTILKEKAHFTWHGEPVLVQRGNDFKGYFKGHGNKLGRHAEISQAVGLDEKNRQNIEIVTHHIIQFMLILVTRNL